MPKPLCGLFADAHLQESAWANSLLRFDSMYALQQIADFACEHKLKKLIGAGDLIDKQRNRAAPINFFHRILDQLADNRVSFLFLQGQHDYDSPPWLAGHSWADHVHKKEFNIGDFTAYGLDFQPAGKLQEELDLIPKGTDILVCHQAWGEWMGEITSPQGDFAHIPVVSTVFTGDYHNVVSDSRVGKDGQKLLCMSPGATCLQAINEPRKHFFFTLDDDGQFRVHRLKSRVVIDCSMLSRNEDVEALLKDLDGWLEEARLSAIGMQLPEALCKSILYVTYTHKLTDVPRRVEKAVNGRAHIFWKEVAPSREEVAGRDCFKVANGEAVTPLSLLPVYLDKDEEPEAQQLATQLLSVQPFQEEFERWRAEFLQQDEE